MSKFFRAFSSTTFDHQFPLRCRLLLRLGYVPRILRLVVEMIILGFICPVYPCRLQLSPKLERQEFDPRRENSSVIATF